MEPRPGVRPAVIRREGQDRLFIEWTDGAKGFVTWDKLRSNCPCATCREDRAKPPDPFHILSEREVQAGAPQPMAMSPVGNYAYKIVWNDGHDSGIYTLESLRELCEPSTD
jgi:DUF971 family protein